MNSKKFSKKIKLNLANNFGKVRNKKVERIKQQLSTGAYQVDNCKVAQALFTP